jgi:mannose-1-phosphate guanylyltransferase
MPRGGAPMPLEELPRKARSETAQSMLAAGGFLWNAGIFLMRAPM